MPWFYYVGRLIVRMLLLLLTRWQVRGRENVPSQGPVLVVANHLNLADPPLLGVSLGRKVIFMAKKELFRSRVIGYFIGSLGAFPVSRERLGKKALHRAIAGLAGGKALVMFPEGTRSRSGRLKSALPGAALIACRSGAPVLPVGICGTEKIKGIGWLVGRPHITVNIGVPFHLPPVSHKLTKTKLAELSEYIMERIAEILPVEYRGDYGRQGKTDGVKS